MKERTAANNMIVEILFQTEIKQKKIDSSFRVSIGNTSSGKILWMGYEM